MQHTDNWKKTLIKYISLSERKLLPRLTSC